jgi:hypothetical protein
MFLALGDVDHSMSDFDVSSHYVIDDDLQTMWGAHPAKYKPPKVASRPLPKPQTKPSDWERLGTIRHGTSRNCKPHDGKPVMPNDSSVQRAYTYNTYNI